MKMNRFIVLPLCIMLLLIMGSSSLVQAEISLYKDKFTVTGFLRYELGLHTAGRRAVCDHRAGVGQCVNRRIYAGSAHGGLPLTSCGVAALASDRRVSPPDPERVGPAGRVQRGEAVGRRIGGRQAGRGTGRRCLGQRGRGCERGGGGHGGGAARQ